MKKKLLIFSFLYFWGMVLFAQPFYDAKWIVGYNTYPFDTFDGALIDFRQDSVKVNYWDKQMQMSRSVAVLCNIQGDLIAFSNGCYVSNAKQEIVQNGDSLSLSPSLLSTCVNDGSFWYQNLFFLPSSLDSNLFFLFHLDHTQTNTMAYGNPLYLSTMDKSFNNNQGKITQKRKILLKDKISSSQTVACKHSNGKDWWLIAPRLWSNTYIKILLREDSIIKIKTQSIGREWEEYGFGGQVAFSPDGTYYARVNPPNGVQLFKFNRCNGNFSDSNEIFIENYPSKEYSHSGLAFSPNSSFLYVTTNKKLFQIDLKADSIAKSKILIDTSDWHQSIDHSRFYMCQLAPNNKIYIGCAGTSNVLHTIHSPDSLGIKCNLKQHDLKLPTYYDTGIPYFPNYRLGAAATPCLIADDDTPNEAPLTVQLYPNPARQQLTVQLFDSSPATIRFYNSVGILVYEKTSAEINTSIEIGAWVSGIYFCKVRQGGKEAIQKVVIQN
jgi:hypothetical protein